MYTYLLKRLGLAIASLFILTFLSYIFLTIFAKSDPFIDIDSPPVKGSESDLEILRLKEAAGFTDPVVIRYFRWLGNIFSGNIGQFYSKANKGRTIHETFFGPLPYSIRFVLPSFVFSVLLGIMFGFISAYNRGKFIDHLTQFFVRVFVSIPSFVLAPFFLIFAYKLGLGAYLDTPGDGDQVFSINSISTYFMPILMITILSMSGYASITRNNTVDILSSNYILIARSKGLSETKIFFKYVLRNTSIPIVSVVLPGFTALLSGSFIVEQIFGIPGTSAQFIRAFPEGEIDLSMFNILFFGGISIILSIILDFLFVVLDPRIKISSQNNLNIFKIIYFSLKRKQILSSIKKQEAELRNK